MRRVPEARRNVEREGCGYVESVGRQEKRWGYVVHRRHGIKSDGYEWVSEEMEGEYRRG